MTESTVRLVSECITTQLRRAYIFAAASAGIPSGKAPDVFMSVCVFVCYILHRATVQQISASNNFGLHHPARPSAPTLLHGAASPRHQSDVETTFGLHDMHTKFRITLWSRHLVRAHSENCLSSWQLKQNSILFC